jgi:glutathione S-transferase
LTFADMNLLPILHGVKNFPEGRELMDSAKNLRAYFERHSARQSYQRVRPSAIPILAARDS